MVYGEMLSLARHLVLMVSEEYYSSQYYCFLMLFKCNFFYIAKLWVVADVIACFLYVVSDVNTTF